VKLPPRWRHFTAVTTRAIPMRWVLLFSLAGCATAPPPAPDDRYAVTRMKNGPSLYETGRFAAVPVSNGGLRIDEGPIDGPTSAPPASGPARARSRRLSSRHARLRKEGAPAR
jgi:hypothetical protein